MKELRKAVFAITFLLIIPFAIQCASPKITVPEFQKQAPFAINKVYFQNWYAGVKLGNTGVDIFVPLENKNQNVKIDSIFFKNLKGKLSENKGSYTVLLREEPVSIFQEEPRNQFGLDDDEFVISYIQDNETKYYKTNNSKQLSSVSFQYVKKSYLKSENRDVIVSLDEDEFED
ncbi:MAG: hypothetical protein Wins2KO_04850 [Winogradskyella sp.]